MSPASSRRLQRPKSSRHLGAVTTRHSKQCFPIHDPEYYPPVPPPVVRSPTAQSPQQSHFHHTPKPVCTYHMERDDSVESGLTVLSDPHLAAFADADGDLSGYDSVTIPSMFDTASYNSDDEHSDAVTPSRGVRGGGVMRDHQAQMADYSTHRRQAPLVPPGFEHASPKTKQAVHGASTGTVSPSGIYAMTEDEFLDSLELGRCIGQGNWGEVFIARAKTHESSRLGHLASAKSVRAAGGLLAIKVVKRRHNSVAVPCIRALWTEMKIIRSLRHEPHPSVIQFEAFVISSACAAVLMPYHGKGFDIPTPLPKAVHYFRQLASAVSYLHERGITHNDIKPSNIVVSFDDVPVLVDFGFAQLHKADDRARFLSSQQWGTLEYLDPLRASGQAHDERKSDVWSLGVTMFEVIVGRTPFEMGEDETFETPERWEEYRDRTRSGRWYGTYNIGHGYLEEVLKLMLYPDPSFRPWASQVYLALTSILADPDLSVLETPPFVRSAVDPLADEKSVLVERQKLRDKEQRDREFAVKEQARLQKAAQEATERIRKLKKVKSDISGNKKPKDVRPATAGPLTESLKQTRSVAQLRPAKQLPSVHRRVGETSGQENIKVTTPDNSKAKLQDNIKIHVVQTKPSTPVHTPPRVRVHEAVGDIKPMRISSATYKPLARPATASGLLQQAPTSSRVQTPTSPQVQSPASPSPPSAQAAAIRDEALQETMRTLMGARQASVPRGYGHASPGKVRPKSEAAAYVRDVRPLSRKPVPATATPTKRMTDGRMPPMLEVDISTSTVFGPNLLEASTQAPELHLVSRYRGAGEWRQQLALPTSPNRRAKQSTAPSDIIAQPADGALSDLDRLAGWAKRVEAYVQEAKKAVAEGRAVPVMPDMPDDLESLTGMLGRPASSAAPPPARNALVPLASSRGTSETMFEVPAPPGVVPGSKPHYQKREHGKGDTKPEPTLKRSGMSQVFKRFVSERASVISERTAPAPPVVTKRVTVRQSESQLGNMYATLPRRGGVVEFDTISDIEEEELLAEIGPLAGAARRMAKPSSMMSLRERAKGVMGFGDKGKHATLPRRAVNPVEPAPAPTPGEPMGLPTHKHDTKDKDARKSIFKLFKGKKAT